MSDLPQYVSVIVPLYNKATTIAQTLSSIQQQDYDHFEAIIVDDGSTDHWAEAVAPFRNDLRFRFIAQQHAGVSAARNNGVQAASHPWISFLDADDYWAPQFLSSLMALAGRFPECDVFCTGRSYVMGDRVLRYVNKAIPGHDQIGPVNYIRNIALGNPAINSSNNLIRRQLMMAEPFRTEMVKFEDHELWMRLLSTRLYIMHNLPLSFYRKASLKGSPLQAEDLISLNAYLNTLRNSFDNAKGSNRFWLRYFFTSFCLYLLKKNKLHRKDVFDSFRPYMDMVFLPVRWYVKILMSN